MTKGILGKKIGMTQIFTKDGILVPVTVIEATPNVVLQKKTVDTDGYEAVQLGFGEFGQTEERISSLANKPELGHAKKANTTPKRFLREIAGSGMSQFNVGEEVKANIFAEGEIVDVTGISKGKGYSGVIKRHNFHRGPMAHGSGYHRGTGSMGSIDAARIKKGKKLAGRLGAEKVTIQNLQIVKVDLEKNVILVRGSVPGAKKSTVLITNSVKKNPNGAINPEARA